MWLSYFLCSKCLDLLLAHYKNNTFMIQFFHEIFIIQVLSDGSARILRLLHLNSWRLEAFVWSSSMKEKRPAKHLSLPAEPHGKLRFWGSTAWSIWALSLPTAVWALRSLSTIKSQSRGRCRARWSLQPSPLNPEEPGVPAPLLRGRHWANPAQTCCRHPGSSAALQLHCCSAALPSPAGVTSTAPVHLLSHPSWTCTAHFSSAPWSTFLCLNTVIRISTPSFKTKLPQFLQASPADRAFRLSPCTPHISHTDYFLF